MSSSAVFALLAGALVVAGAVLLLWRSRGSARLDRILLETARAREASESVDRRFEEMRRSVEDRVRGVEQTLSQGQKGVADHLGESGKLLKDVGEQMGRIFEASQKIEKLAGNVTQLEDLLKPPKMRGTLGEAFLEEALRQALPPGSWQMQYRFGDGVSVDAVIRLKDRWVPVDSVESLPLHPGFAEAWPVIRDALQPVTVIVDGANVMGARADGWWRDRAGAAVRLHDELAGLSTRGVTSFPDGAAGAALDRWFPRIVLVIEGAARAAADRLAARAGAPKAGDGPEPGNGVVVVAARGSGDDTIAALAAETDGRRLVVTADRELRRRSTAAGAAVTGPRWLLGLL